MPEDGRETLVYGTCLESGEASGIASATLGAAAAGLLVILAGALVRGPLTRVPENTLKFVVGLMLTTFGTFWAEEGFGVDWPLADLFLLVLAAVYLLAACGLALWLKQIKQRKTRQESLVPAPVSAEKEKAER